MNRRCFVIVSGLAWLAGATASQAHHSFAAEYDRDRTITVTGVVQKLEWTNPHGSSSYGTSNSARRTG